MSTGSCTGILTSLYRWVELRRKREERESRSCVRLGCLLRINSSEHSQAAGITESGGDQGRCWSVVSACLDVVAVKRKGKAAQ